jgi:hypothetical protein
MEVSGRLYVSAALNLGGEPPVPNLQDGIHGVQKRKISTSAGNRTPIPSSLWNVSSVLTTGTITKKKTP